jgi:hypothetical protein
MMKKIFFCLLSILLVIVLLSGSTIQNKLIELPPMSNGVRLAIIGDFGQRGRPEARVTTLVKSWNADAVITTGDNIYPSGKQVDFDKNVYRYYDWMIDQEMFFPVLGNHDWGYPWDEGFMAGEIPLLLSLPYLPGNGRYYSVVFGENLVETFIIDSDAREPDGRSATSIQARWLEAEMKNSTATYKLVFLHEPPFSSCLFGDITVMQWPFEDWGADAVFAGHCHFYERIMKNGFPYFINGSGGGQEVTPFETITEGSTVQYLNDFGAQLIEVTADKMIISFITAEGDLIDRFTIPNPNP